MKESAEARQPGKAGTVDVLTIADQLRQMKPSGSNLISNLFVACAGIGFSLLVIFNSADRRSLPGFVAAPLLIGFGGFVRFLDNMTWRSRINRLLRN